MDNSVIAKSGWLHKNNGGLRWDKNWIELYRDGYLKYYESDHSPNAEDTIYMPNECLTIRTGTQIDLSSTPPPPNYNRLCMFSVSTLNNKTWLFCGESLDDMRAWQLALEQARLLIVRPCFSTPTSLTHHLTGLPPNMANSHQPLYYNMASSYMPGFTDGSMTYLSHNRLPLTSSPISSPSLYSNYPNHLYSSGLSYPFPYNPSSHHLPSLYNRQPSLPDQQQNTYPRPDGRDLAVGMLTGAAVGSMMWGPFVWW